MVEREKSFFRKEVVVEGGGEGREGEGENSGGDSERDI